MAVTLAAGRCWRSWCGGWAGMRACGPPAGAFSRWPSAPAGVHSLFGSTWPGRQPAPRKMSPAYAAAVEGLATPGMLVLMLAAIIVGAAIGAWLGSPLWKRGQARIHIRKHEPYRNTAERKCRMKTKRENPLKVLFSFSGEAREK